MYKCNLVFLCKKKENDVILMSNDHEKKVEQENDCEPYITYIKMQRRKSSIHPAK